MVRRDVGLWIVGAVLITTYRDDQVRVWICAEISKQFFERYTAYLSRTGEVRVVGNSVCRLGESQEIVVRNVACRTCRQAYQFASDFEVEWGKARAAQSGKGSGRSRGVRITGKIKYGAREKEGSGCQQGRTQQSHGPC